MELLWMNHGRNIQDGRREIFACLKSDKSFSFTWGTNEVCIKRVIGASGMKPDNCHILLLNMSFEKRRT
jgi:hypothetical protein